MWVSIAKKSHQYWVITLRQSAFSAAYLYNLSLYKLIAEAKYSSRYRALTKSYTPLTVEKWILFTLPIPNPDSLFIGLYLLKGWDKGYLWNFMENLVYNFKLGTWCKPRQSNSLLFPYTTRLRMQNILIFISSTITWRVPLISFSLKDFKTNRIIISK